MKISTNNQNCLAFFLLYEIPQNTFNFSFFLFQQKSFHETRFPSLSRNECNSSTCRAHAFVSTSKYHVQVDSIKENIYAVDISIGTYVFQTFSCLFSFLTLVSSFIFSVLLTPQVEHSCGNLSDFCILPEISCLQMSGCCGHISVDGSRGPSINACADNKTLRAHTK